MGVTIRDVMGALDAFASPGLAEPWDRPGLQVGDPDARVDAVLVAVDPSPPALAQARSHGVQLLLTHHPLLLDPLARIDLSSAVGRLLAELIREGIGVIACHTNLDRVQGGVNDVLARRLGLEGLQPLLPGEGQVRLTVAVPSGHEPGVVRALAASGAGSVGWYPGSAFSVPGVETSVRPAGSELSAGPAGRPAEEKVTHLQAAVPKSRVGSIRRALIGAHPHEEPAIDLCPLENPSRESGLGRLGVLPEPVSLAEFAAEVVRRLDAPGARFVGEASRVIERVALIGGSGATLWREAQCAGADVLVTGDVKYHTAREAESSGFCIVDAGHGCTETGAVDALAGALEDWARTAQARIRVETYVEPEPFRWVVA